MYACIRELHQKGSNNVAWTAPSHCPNQCCQVVKRTPWRQIHWNCNTNAIIFIEDIVLYKCCLQRSHFYSVSVCQITWYGYVIMSVMVSHITDVSIVCPTVCSGTNQSKHQSFASPALVKGIHRWRVPLTKGQYRGKCFHLMTSPCCSDLDIILA